MAEMDLDRVVEATVEEDITLTLSSGARVKPKRVPDNLIMVLRRQNPPPKPPIVTIERDGRRPEREENPLDPDYVQATEDYQVELGNRMTDLIFVRGMDVLELPSDVTPYDEDDEWAEELAAVGLDIPEGKVERYLLWIRTFIVPTMEDFAAITTAYSAIEETPEEDIKAKEDQFRGDSNGATSQELD